jgi:hypothetical protein
VSYRNKVQVLRESPMWLLRRSRYAQPGVHDVRNRPSKNLTENETHSNRADQTSRAGV